MSASRYVILEAFVGLILIASSVLFGAVYDWIWLGLCGAIYFLLIIFPESIYEFQKYPLICRISAVFLASWLMFQSVWISVYPYESGLELLKWGALSLLSFLILPSLPRTSLIRILFLILLLGVLQSLYGFWQIHSTQEWVLWQKKDSYINFLTGTFLNRNHMAAFLELCLGIHIGYFFYFFSEKKWLLSFIVFLLFCISITGFFLTGSRMGQVSFIFSLFIFIWIYLPKRKAASFVTIGALGLLLLSRSQNIFWRWQSEDLAYSFLGRLDTWRSTLRMIKDHPFGIGLGNFEWVFPQYQSAGSFQGWSHAHQDYLELAATLGIPSLIFLLFFFTGLVLYLFRRFVQISLKTKPLLWGCGLSLVSFSIHSLADFNFAIFANSLFFLVLVGVIINYVQTEA